MTQRMNCHFESNSVILLQLLEKTRKLTIVGTLDVQARNESGRHNFDILIKWPKDRLFLPQPAPCVAQGKLGTKYGVFCR